MTTIVLPPDLDAKVRARIASGEASDATEVIRAGLEALDAAEDATKLSAIRARIGKSIADPRPSMPGDDVFDRVERALQAFAKK
jgi:antitoxin ParD1/3/4